MKQSFFDPPSNCDKCLRLFSYRQNNRKKHPYFFNSPVPSFGTLTSELIIVGLAPGIKGANQTGRPFTGDHAGNLLYSALLKFGLAKGSYSVDGEDSLQLINCRITNAVKCVPPQNRPTGPEVANCRQYLSKELENMPNLKIILALGILSHKAILSVYREKKSQKPFKHGRVFQLNNGVKLINSYHCSRYNTNTGRLTHTMFFDVFKNVRDLLCEKFIQT